MIYTDVLVIGSGISGLSYALKVAHLCPDMKICIVTKSNEDESNTKYAQGGVAVVTDFKKDSFKKHIEDTLRAGDGMCIREVVELVVKEGPERMSEMVQWGAYFDQDEYQDYDLAREGGHTENRIRHHKDITGAEIERTLLEAVKKCHNIKILNHHYAVDLITEDTIPGNLSHESYLTCYGAYVLDIKTQQVVKMTAKITLIATGGCGQLYKNTTNSIIATGDGIGLAHRAKAKISHMQFLQFHPTAFYKKDAGQLPLISEAVRGFGAKLCTTKGLPFMYLYDAREELASRDIVSRAIVQELKTSGDAHVCLDCRHLNKESFLDHFPNIYQQCKEEGLDMFKDLIPVIPASHYLCGGIVVDSYGQSTIENMFAVGECTYTGLHGANRLASNSLLEALVFAHRAALKTILKLQDHLFNNKYWNQIPEFHQEEGKEIEELTMLAFLREGLQSMMSDLVGIVRSDTMLKEAEQQQEQIYRTVNQIYTDSKLSPELCELRNLVSVASLIITQSIEEKKNRGTFYNKNLASYEKA